MHFKGAKGCFIVYDLTSRESFMNVNKWLKNAKDLTNQECQIILLGNKADADRNQPQ
jgi:GTPase SAR1 family protein